MVIHGQHQPPAILNLFLMDGRYTEWTGVDTRRLSLFQMINKMRPLFFFFFLLSCPVAWAQSRVVASYRLGNSFPMTQDPDDIFMRFDTAHFYNIIVQHTQDAQELIINYGDLSDGVIRHRDTISGLPRSFRLKDFIANKDYIFVCGRDVHVYYRPGAMESSFVQSIPLPDEDTGKSVYNGCAYLTDSTVLLYNIYNYHPCDGYAGTQLAVLDLHSNTITRKRRMPFPGIALSHLCANWITVAGQHIYIINPLTARVSVFSGQLQPVDSFGLPTIFNHAEQDSNRVYLSYLDHTLQREWRRIDSLRALHIPAETACKSDIYGKSFIFEVISRTRERYAFIELLEARVDGKLTLVVSRPDYEDRFRDVYVLDPEHKGKGMKQYKRWPCVPADTPANNDAFFVTPLSNARLNFPLFKGNTAYWMSLVSPADFVVHPGDNMEQKVYDYFQQQGYTPTIVRTAF